MSLPETFNSEISMLNEQLGTNHDWVQKELFRTQKLHHDQQVKKK